jgi:hypothetical protein
MAGCIWGMGTGYVAGRYPYPSTANAPSLKDTRPIDTRATKEHPREIHGRYTGDTRAGVGDTPPVKAQRCTELGPAVADHRRLPWRYGTVAVVGRSAHPATARRRGLCHQAAAEDHAATFATRAPALTPERYTDHQDAGSTPARASRDGVAHPPGESQSYRVRHGQ